MSQKSAARIEAERLCKEYPNRGRKILAEVLIGKNNPYHLTKSKAEGLIRRARGYTERIKNGVNNSRYDLSGNWVKFIPTSDYTAPKHIRLDSIRIGLLPDIHIPYQDNNSLKLAIEYLRKIKCDCIVLTGDTLDFYGLSRFDKDPKARDAVGELAACKMFLKSLRMAFPNDRIIFKQGNHERRWERMLYENPQIAGLDAIQLPAVLGMSELKIEYVGKRSMIIVGGSMKDGMPRNGLAIIHGDEANVNGGVNPARTLFLRMGICAICGHLHKRSEHQESIADGKTVSTWSMGCLCGRWPEYASINKWTAGFADISVDGEQFVVHNHSIINGAVY